jgi:hypothetical protein
MRFNLCDAHELTVGWVACRYAQLARHIGNVMQQTAKLPERISQLLSRIEGMLICQARFGQSLS